MKFLAKSVACLLVIGVPIVKVSEVHAEPPRVQIIDGARAPVSEYPAVARIIVGGSFLCTGTLITKGHVLTAAHCFFDGRNRPITDAQYIGLQLGGVSRPVARVDIHPSYVPRSAACVEGEVDAAIVALQSEASDVTPVPFLRDSPVVGTQLLLAGFGTQGVGAIGEDGTIPPKGYLNVGTTEIESVSQNYVSWYFERGEANTASGDSGGPAFADVNGARALQSITCGGTERAQFGTSSSNTRLDVIAPWIDATTGVTPVNEPPGLVLPDSFTIAQNEPFNYAVQVTGTTPVSLSATGLPSGLSLDGTSITGIPVEVGSFTVALTASNVAGSATGTLTMNVTPFDPATALTLTKASVDFSEDASDLLTLRGTLRLGTKFSPRRARLRLQIAGLEDRFTLNRLGIAQRRNGYDFVKLAGRWRRGLFVSPLVRFIVGLGDKRSLFDKLDQLFPYDTSTLDATYRVSLPVELEINGAILRSTILMRNVPGTEKWVSE